MTKIKLTIGDWSDDGHGMSEDIFINSNISATEIKNAAIESCKELKLSFDTDESFFSTTSWKEENKYRICTEYEINNLSSEAIAILIANNAPIKEWLDEDGDCFLGVEMFTELYLWFAERRLAHFKYTIIKDNAPYINIGGYGLFSH